MVFRDAEWFAKKYIYIYNKYLLKVKGDNEK